MTDVEAAMDRCHKRLFRASEAKKAYADLWDRALKAVTHDSDEWRVLDQQRGGLVERDFHVSHGLAVAIAGRDDYVEPRDCHQFGKIRAAIRKLLEAREPEFLRAQKRRKKQVFFEAGEEYQAKRHLFERMKQATRSLGVIDEYLDDEVFAYLESLDPHVELKLLTGQRKPIFGKLFTIIDETTVVHLGASINRAGKKAFMVNEVEDPEERKQLLDSFNSWWQKGQQIP